MAGPVDTRDTAQMPLVQAGIDTLAIDLDLGAAWTEASRAFVLEPVAIEFGSLLKATARVSLEGLLSGVPRLQPSSSEDGEPHADFSWPSAISFDASTAMQAVSASRTTAPRRRTELLSSRMLPSPADYAGGGTETLTDGRCSIF
jgi:hypothetical protein